MYKYVITNSELTSRNVLALTLKPVSRPDLFPYKAGQYVTIGWKHGERPTPVRCFSLVTSPTQRGAVKIAMTLQGDFTKAAATLAIGQEVTLRGPFGDFTLEPEASGHVMIAGGIGITPLLSMLRYATDRGVKLPLTLLYGCRSQDDVSFLPEFDELCRLNPRLAVVYAITSGPVDKLAGRQVVSGYIDRDLLKKAGQRQGPGAEFYICGPPKFMTAMNETLEELGVGSGYIHTESFSQGKLRGQTGLYAGIYALTALAIVGGVGLMSAKQLASNFLNSQNSAPAVTAAPTDGGSAGAGVGSGVGTGSGAGATPSAVDTSTPAPTPYYQPRTKVS
jgi:ferredoxin-NADP reductase